MFSASVVITTKNRREELVKAIESAMGQRGLLETKSPGQIADILANPDELSEALSDSHPFAGCMLYLANGR